MALLQILQKHIGIEELLTTKVNGSVLFKISLRFSLTYKCMSLAYNIQDGNGLQLEHNESKAQASIGQFSVYYLPIGGRL